MRLARCLLGLFAYGLVGACTEPEHLCAGGAYRSGVLGESCQLGPGSSCPQELPRAIVTSDGVLCAGEQGEMSSWCLAAAQGRGEGCNTATLRNDDRCLAAVSLDSLACDGLVNQCGASAGSSLNAVGDRFTEDPSGCGGSIDLGGDYGNPPTGSTLVASWPDFGGAEALGFEMRLAVTLSAVPDDRAGDDTAGIVFNQPDVPLFLFVSRTLGGGLRGVARISLAIGTCADGGDLPALTVAAEQELHVGQRASITVGLEPSGTAYLEVDGMRATRSGPRCQIRPLSTPIDGFVLGPFPGSVDDVVILRRGGEGTPPPMCPMPARCGQPPECGPPPMACP